MLAWIVVGSVRRQVDQLKARQPVVGLQHVLEDLGVVEAGVVQDDCDPVVAGLSSESVRGQDDRFGVLVFSMEYLHLLAY